MPSAVFLSYASQDSEAARRICESLRSSGIEVWFDIEGGLEHGDEWDAKIRRHIKECVLFIPIISANTQARHEGYFRIEWDLAAERARGIAQGVAFILPVVVDSTSEPEALVPDRFRKVQWTKMPGGVVPPEVLARFLKLWAQKTGSAPIEVPKPQGSRAPAPRHYETPEAKSSSKTYAIVGVAAALVLAAGGWWLFGGRGAANTPPPPQVVIAPVPTPTPAPTHAPAAQPEIEQKSVAVLALSNLSPDKDDAYFSDGVSEDLINVLANLPGLKVAARTSAFYFKGKQVPVAEVAKQLGVAFVVEGSVRRDASRVRITVQLIKAADGLQLWTKDYDRELKDIFSVQDEIAGLIAKNLQLQIGDALAAPRPTVDPEAFRLFLAGRAQAEKASIEGLNFGVTDLQKAVEIDPRFAAAWAQLARAYIQLTRRGGIDIESGYEKARGAVAKAVALEPDSPEVLVAQGWVKRTADWDWKGARQAFKRALELQPNNPDTLADAAVFFFNTGQTSEGLELARRAADLDPLNAQTQVNLSLAFMCSGELNRAEQAGRRAIQLSPSGPSYHGNLAIILAVLDRPQKAEQEASLETDELSRRTAFAFVSIDRGVKLKAAAQARQIEELAPARGQSADIHASAAEVYSMLNDKDSAFASLQRSLAARDPALAWIKVDPSFRNLHGDPRWDVLVRKIGLADDQLK